jgi:hypothetical protein
MVGAVAKAKHVNKNNEIDAQNESKSSEKRDKLMAKQHQKLTISVRTSPPAA